MDVITEENALIMIYVTVAILIFKENIAMNI